MPGEQLDLYLPTGPAPAGGRPVILALPGGGWRWVRRQDLGATVSQFARLGYAVAVADYAYSTGRPGSSVWPANIDDVRRAVEWLRSRAGRFGLDPGRVAVWGESAGGHLAALLGTDPGSPAARVQAVIDFYGPADLTRLYGESATDRPYLETFLGGTPSQVPSLYQDASPVTHVAPGNPPFFIEQGTADTAVPPDQSVELAGALSAAGVPVHLDLWPGQTHGFRLTPAPGVNLLGSILNFLHDAL
jgi:acetyl esterase/lipase